MSCNPISNVVISSPFYVAALEKLCDDKNFLKSTLWPVLETFQLSAHIREFRCKSVGMLQREGAEGRDLCLTETALDNHVLLEGEGTCKPYGSILVMSPHLDV